MKKKIEQETIKVVHLQIQSSSNGEKDLKEGQRERDPKPYLIHEGVLVCFFRKKDLRAFYWVWGFSRRPVL